MIPTRTREIMIISKDLAARLVTAKSAPAMRKMLFSSKHFFLGSRESKRKLKKEEKKVNVWFATLWDGLVQHRMDKRFLSSKARMFYFL